KAPTPTSRGQRLLTGIVQGRAASPGLASGPKAKPQMKMEMNMRKQSVNDRNPTNVNRMTQFAFPDPAARQVSLAGDFNNWDTKAGPMHKGPDGVWHLSVALKPGRHEYR